MDTGDDVGANPPDTARHRRKWKTAERLLAALAALIAVIGGAVWVVHGVTRDSPVEKEQKLVEQLRPGQTLDRATEIMDNKPHYTQRLASGNRLYQYNRKWERIQLLVDPDNISVLSVGIFADRTDFRPSFPLGTESKLTINRTPYGEVLGEPSRVFGGCGVHSGSYFETHSLGETGVGAIIAVGIHDSFRGNTSMGPSCGGLQKAPEDCVPSEIEDTGAWRPRNNPQCLTSTPAGDFRKNTAIAALVVTKQLGLTEDMFQSPYVLAGGND
ncbi:hypothetical protein [Streptomyces sp. NBC_00829]|uniref:hypothetical protein n=1 Tax=Streptomyces sp. NBC_00829 TaxID=2903679 RepID=UPI003864EA5F|nr:hypothetical protein OG293_38530 [Streptomyces sp. NBC_00829]